MQQRFAAKFLGVAVLALAVSVVGLSPASAAPRPGPASVAARPGPTSVRQLVAAHQPASHAATSSRHAVAIPGEDDDETFLGISPGCAVGGGKAELSSYVVSGAKLKLDWVLTGTDLRKTGTVKTKVDRGVLLELPSVRTGTYRLTLAQHGRTALVADETFAVLPCVAVKATCRAVTFTNPAGNPSVYVSYQGHKKDQEFDLELAPGTSRTVRADYSKIDYDTSTDLDDGPFTLGDGTVRVKQKCSHDPAQPGDNAVQTWALTSCSAAGVPAAVSLLWSVQPSVTQRRYEVLDSGQHVVLQGSFKGGHDAEASLPAGAYTYRSYANGIVQPFEDVAFQVLTCVEVIPHCRSIEVRNPNGLALTVLALSTDDDPVEVDGDGDETPLAAHSTVTIPWTGKTASVVALPASGSGSFDSAFVSLASPWSFDDDEPAYVAVPQNC